MNRCLHTVSHRIHHGSARTGATLWRVILCQRQLMWLASVSIFALFMAGCTITIHVDPLDPGQPREETRETVEFPTEDEEAEIADKFCIFKPDGSGYTSGGGGYTSGGGGYTSGGGGDEPHGLRVWTTARHELTTRGLGLSSTAPLTEATTLLQNRTTVLLVIDQFSRLDEERGERIYFDLNQELETATPPEAELWRNERNTVLLYPLDIETFRTDVVVPRTKEVITTLANENPTVDFVLNMSWMILPCGERPTTVDEYIGTICSATDETKEKLAHLKELQEFLDKRVGLPDVETMCAEFVANGGAAMGITLMDIYDVTYYDAIWGTSLFGSATATAFYAQFAQEGIVDFALVAETFAADPLFQQTTVCFGDAADRASELAREICPEPLLVASPLEPDREPSREELGDIVAQICEDERLWPAVRELFAEYGVNFGIADLCGSPELIDRLWIEYFENAENGALYFGLRAMPEAELGRTLVASTETLRQRCAEPPSTLWQELAPLLVRLGTSRTELCGDPETVIEPLIEEINDGNEIPHWVYLLIGILEQHGMGGIAHTAVSVAAAGNSSQPFPYAPGLWDSVVSVSGADCDCAAAPAFYSNDGEILLDGRHPDLNGLIGTSYAAPRLSAITALYLAAGGKSPCATAPGVHPVFGYMPEMQGQPPADWRNLSLSAAVPEFCTGFAP